jgi:hypothetical protein
MAKADDKLHDKIAAGLADTRVSPAILAYKMMSESLYVNESMVQYMVNYINAMASAKVVPLHLADIQALCVNLKSSLEELGLIGTIGRQPVDNTEFLAI